MRSGELTDQRLSHTTNAYHIIPEELPVAIVRTEIPNLLAHRRSTSLAEISLLGLGFVDTLGEGSSIFIGSILGLLGVAALQCDAVTLVLETLRSNKTLDLGSLGIWLLALALRLNLTTDNELADIVILGETEELADLRGTLGTKTLGVNDIGDTWDITIALLDDGESENREIHSNDAATNRLALALTSTARTVAGVAFAEEESDTSGMHNTLFHRETLLVVATGDLEDVALELITNAVAWDLSAHSLVHEYTQLSLIFDLNKLLAAIGREGDVQLHLDGGPGQE